MTYVDKIDAYFDRTRNLWIRFFGLFTFLLLALYIPAQLTSQINQKEQKYQELVDEMEEMKTRMSFYQLSFDKQQVVMKEVDCLAQNIYYEAGAEPIEGKIAVAQVTMNRVRSGDYASTVCGVVKQKIKGTCQFSWVCVKSKAISSTTSAWRDSKRIAENILLSKKKYSIIPPTVMNYHASYVTPTWATSSVFVKQIGGHLFYKTNT